MAWDKDDYTRKKVINKLPSHSGKTIYEEDDISGLDIHSDDIKGNYIDPVPATAVVELVAEQISLQILTEDITVPNNQAWYLDDVGRVVNWISTKFGAAYEIQIFDNSDIEIFPTDELDWIFDYPTGTVLFNGDLSGVAQPLKISGYKYVGSYLTELAGAGAVVAGYDNVFFVDGVNGNDTTGKPGLKSTSYATINAASTDAYNDFIANSDNKNLVWIIYDPAAYKEFSITRNGVDIFCERGVIVWTDIADRSIINDLNGAANGSGVVSEFKVFGEGEFYNELYSSINDSEGVNIRTGSTIQIEAAVIDNAQIWNNDALTIEFTNINFIFGHNSHRNKNIISRNCTFNVGYTIGGFSGLGTSLEFYDCTFIVSADDAASLYPVRNLAGVIIFTMNPVVQPFLDTTGLSNDQVINAIALNTTGRQNIAGIEWIENTANRINFVDFKTKLIDCEILVQKRSCVGVAFVQQCTSTSGRLEINNLIVRNEDTVGDTVALLSGRETVTGTVQHGFSIAGFSQNCDRIRKLFDQTANFISLLEDYVEIIDKPDNTDNYLTPSATSGDGEATGITITKEPQGILLVIVNNNVFVVSENTADICYFSRDAGSTAIPLAEIAPTDELFWNGVQATFDLTVTDRIHLIYL